ncbi:MAG: hypothetical protein H8F28_25780 [Fibrella sp.]|nr:hypothetical protein [Armatimonadota bacterium]
MRNFRWCEISISLPGYHAATFWEDGDATPAAEAECATVVSLSKFKQDNDWKRAKTIAGANRPGENGNG